MKDRIAIRAGRETELRRVGKVGARETGTTLVLPLLLVAALAGGAVHLGLIGPPAALLCGFGTLLAGLGWRGSIRARREARRLSDEVSALSMRLLRLEERAASPSREGAALPSETLSDLTDDIGVLGGAMRTLASAMSEQEREIAGLRHRLDAPDEAPEPGPRVIPSLFRAPAEPPPPETGEGASAAARDRAIAAALRAGSIELDIRTVVSLPQRRPVLHDARPRLRLPGGTLLDAADVRPVAEPLGLGVTLDETLFGRACTAAAGRSDLRPIAVPLSSATLADDATMRRLCVQAEAAPPGAVLVGAGSAAWTEAGARAGLDRLAGQGIGLLATLPGAGAIDPTRLALGGVRFARVDAGTLLGQDPAAAGAMLARLAEAGLEVVVDGVDQDGLVPELIELGVSLAAGEVFARPRLPVDVAAEAPVPPAALPPPAAQTPASPADPMDEAVRSLRSVLRRAG